MISGKEKKLNYLNSLNIRSKICPGYQSDHFLDFSLLIVKLISTSLFLYLSVLCIPYNGS